MRNKMQHSLPTSTLIKSTGLALTLAATSLIFLILPAEYNIDPTGVGEKLGLTVLAQQAPALIMTNDSAVKQSSDSFEIIVPALKGIEFKFAMEQFKKMQYKWHSQDQALSFDLHGEPEGDTTGYFESYALATSNEMKGSFTTPFSGSHGWYWYNESNSAVTVQLEVTGEYTVIGLK